MAHRVETVRDGERAMELPFTGEAFLEVFARYNRAIWPAHVGAYGLGLLAFAMALRGRPLATRLVPGLLAGAWAFVGGAYHLAFFSEVNPAARLFALLFLVQAALFAWAAVARQLHFGWTTRPRAFVGVALVLYAAIVYPLVGEALGRDWPRNPAFGVAPCPTAIFTWGVLLLARGPVPAPFLVIPALWSLIGFSAALSLGIREDIGLLAAAVLGVALLAWPRRHARVAHR